MKPALPAPHQLLTTLEYRVTLVRPREIVLLGQSADIGLSWALFTGSGIAWEPGGRVLVRAGEEGLGLGLRLLVPVVEMTRLDLAVGEDGTWRIGVYHSFQDGRTTTVASVEKGRQSTGRLQAVPRRHRNRRTSQLVENSDRISPQLSRSFSRARLRSCRTRSRVTPRKPPISSRVIGSRSSSPK